MSPARIDLARWEILELLAGETVGRLCVIDQGFPLAFPVNYRVSHDSDRTSMIFRVQSGAAVGRYQGPASLEVDRIDPDTPWSVIVRGTLRRVLDGQGLPDTEPRVSEGRHQWMALDVVALSGRRFIGKPSTTGFHVEWQNFES